MVSSCQRQHVHGGPPHERRGDRDGTHQLCGDLTHATWIQKPCGKMEASHTQKMCWAQTFFEAVSHPEDHGQKVIQLVTAIKKVVSSAPRAPAASHQKCDLGPTSTGEVKAPNGFKVDTE